MYLENFVYFNPEWEKITRGNFNDTRNHMRLSKVSESERLRIERAFKKHFNPQNTVDNWPRIEIWLKHSTEYYYTSINKDEIIFIYAYEDEWFFIEKYNQDTFESIYYKCDGIEGIEKCLKDNF